MTRLSQSTAKDSRRPPIGKIAGGPDVCALFLAELKARRERLQQLLHLVRMEASRSPAGRSPVRSRVRHEYPGIGRIV